ncbi:MAG: LLM class flavin-dependent oxidoreductase [Acidimicrobiia bacterium]|nr:LLM class flavin-dependent oxidoreductase [Acidimicrobiia bacterium]
MELAICVASKVDDVDYVVRAEELGYTHAWLADSQMIWSDPYATLALAADRTSTIRLGTGVSVAATRPAPVTAASIATINQLAPGRTFLGIGTGNTAMRIMGHKPMRIAEFDDYLTALRPLLAGEEVAFSWRGQTSPVRHIMANAGFVNFADPIPLYVSGFGPRSIGLAGKHGDGAVLGIPPDPEVMGKVWEYLDRGAGDAGRTIDRSDFLTATLTTAVVLEDGEAVDSERVKRLCGAFAVAALHYSYDQWRQYGRAPTPALAGVWDAYTALLEETSEDRRHLRIHQGHNCWVVPEEERFITSELIEATCLVGTADDLVERLRALDQAGLDQVMILPPLEPRYEAIEAVGLQVLPHL